MRILFVLEHFHPYIGGVEFLFWQLSNALAEQGHSVKVITTWYDKQLPQKETINGIDIYRVKCDNRFSFSYKSIPAIYSNIKHFDLVHTTTYTAAPPTWLVARLKNKKSILTFHEYWGELWEELPYLNKTQRFLYRNFERMVAALSFSKVIAVSDFTRDSLIQAGIAASKIVRIYNGLDYEAISRLEKKIETSIAASSPSLTTEKEKPLTFIFVGRLGVSKGLDLLLEAVAIFLKERPSAKLKLVIPTRPEEMYTLIKDEINHLECAHQIEIMHHLSKEDLYKEMKLSSFIIIPSYSEGFCFVAAEACALNVAVVSSQCGALKEVVSGKYIPMASLSTEGLVQALAAADRKEWQYKERQEFTLAKSVEQYIHLYKEMMNG